MSKRKSAGFTVIHWARSQDVGSSSERHLLLLLATYADAKGRCYPSIATIAKQIGLRPRRVRQLEAELERQGLLRRKQSKRPNGRFSVNNYELVMNGRQPATGARTVPSAKNNRRQSAAAPAALPDRTGGSGLPCHELSKRTANGNSKKPKKKVALKSDRATPSPSSSTAGGAGRRRMSQARAIRTANEPRRQSATDGDPLPTEAQVSDLRELVGVEDARLWLARNRPTRALLRNHIEELRDFA